MIITDEKLLRISCDDVVSIEEAVELRNSLEQELASSAENGRSGIGLACPQIAIAKKMAIVRVPKDTGGYYSIDLVNCKIQSAYDKFIFEEEGCLSFPDRIERTMRYREVFVVNNLLPPHSFVAEGLLAVCIQHELDHLNGILLPDVALSKNKITTIDNKNKLL